MSDHDNRVLDWDSTGGGDALQDRSLTLSDVHSGGVSIACVSVWRLPFEQGDNGADAHNGSKKGNAKRSQGEHGG